MCYATPYFDVPVSGQFYLRGCPESGPFDWDIGALVNQRHALVRNNNVLVSWC